jgi:hypothetical protein
MISRLYERPNEETLFTSGWKDNAGFFGCSDVYMTLPFTSRERRLLVDCEARARSFSFQNSSAINEEKEGSESLFSPCELCDEERFLPNRCPRPLLSLPSYLRMAGDSSKLILDDRIAAETNKRRNRLFVWIDQYVFAGEVRKNKHFFSDLHRCHDPVLPNSETKDRRLWLDYLPLIRCIAILDTVAEAAYRRTLTEDPSAASEMSNRKRRTRQASRKGFGYYMENIVPGAVWSATDSDVQDLVGAFAEFVMRY